MFYYMAYYWLLLMVHLIKVFSVCETKTIQEYYFNLYLINILQHAAWHKIFFSYTTVHTFQGLRRKKADKNLHYKSSVCLEWKMFSHVATIRQDIQMAMCKQIHFLAEGLLWGLTCILNSFRMYAKAVPAL